jgi:hypothetical protein
MPTFATPEPISVTLELGVGEIRVVASDRRDTVVEVLPHDSGKKADVAAARQTRVEYADGRLLIKGPKGWRRSSIFGAGRESITVDVELPAGSHLRGSAAVGTLECSGRLGECEFKTSAGDLRVAEAGRVQLKTSAGDITLGQSAGDSEVTSALGALRIDSIDGSAVVKNSNGDTWIGRVTGDLRVSSANGRIVVEQAGADVSARTANGDIRLQEVARGEVVAETARGKVDIGVRRGVAAWLDLDTSFGKVESELDATGQPGAGEDEVDVRARTAFGDITIRRAPNARIS